MEKKLPKNWVEVAFTEVFDIDGGTQPPKSEFLSEPTEGYIRLLQIRDFGNKPVPTFIPESAKNRTCEEEDILIARYGASIGRIVTGQKGAYNVALAKVNIPEKIEKQLVMWLLKSHLFQNVIKSFQRTAQSGFNKKDLAGIQIPLPPLLEQQRMVSKLDGVFAHLEETRTRLEKVPELLKEFRQSVLTQAVSGKLTGNSAYKYLSLEDVCTEFKYGSSSKSLNEGRVPVLRMGNLKNGKIDYSDLKFSSNEEEIEKYRLEKGDILFNRTNSPELVGKTSLFDGRIDSIYAGYLIKVRCSNVLMPEFLNFVMNSLYAKTWCLNVKSDGVSQSNINAQKLKSFRVPIPSIREQAEIVRRVEALFFKADAIEKQYQQLKTKIDNLPQAILAKAFRGELTEQLDTDGDAAELLKEIQELKKK